MVSFSPNQLWPGWGNTLFVKEVSQTSHRFGVDYSALVEKVEGTLRSSYSETGWALPTDKDGMVLIENLPFPGSESFDVRHDDYAIPMDRWGQRRARVDLKSGEVTEITIRMEERN